MQNISVEQIYTDYSGKVMAYIRARIRNKADAEDLLSEVFEKIMKKIEDTEDLLRQTARATAGGLLRVRLEGGEDVCMAAMRELVTRNIPVCDFHRAPMNLEKVFMEVTQDDA